jgi:outer membrane lipoprotein-sorting protein
MRCLLTMALLALVTWPAAAQENEAEKLFRALEQKVRTAKTLQLRSDATITGADGKKWHYKGSAIVGEGDKFRWEIEGKRLGHEWKRTYVSDGTDKISFGYDKQPGEDKASVESKGTEKTPKAFGAHFRAALPRDGFVLGFTTDRNSQMPPDLFIMSDFKLAGEEKIGARNTQVIQYSVKTKARDPGFNPASTNVLSMKLWLDTKTKLPVKLAMTGGESDFSAITETYSEFTVDAKVDAKLFELPK